MAIQFIKTPRGEANVMAGPLTPPPEFNTKKFAAKWVKEGPAVAAAAEREHLIGAGGYTADGWLPWLDKDGKPYKVALNSGMHILLHRDLTVQKAVNAIYGNVGKERLMEERQSVSKTNPEGVPVSDPGILDDLVLTKRIGSDESSEWGAGDVKLNAIPGLESGKKVGKPRLKTALRGG